MVSSLCITHAGSQQMVENVLGADGMEGVISNCCGNITRAAPSLSRSPLTHSCLTAVSDCLPGFWKCRLRCLPHCTSTASRRVRLPRSPSPPSTSVVRGHIIHLRLGATAVAQRRHRKGEERAPPPPKLAHSLGRSLAAVVEYSHRVTSFVTR